MKELGKQTCSLLQMRRDLHLRELNVRDPQVGGVVEECAPDVVADVLARLQRGLRVVAVVLRGQLVLELRQRLLEQQQPVVDEVLQGWQQLQQQLLQLQPAGGLVAVEPEELVD